jgi:hypothetical protein
MAGPPAAPNHTFVHGQTADLTISQAATHVDANAGLQTYGSEAATPGYGLRASDVKYSSHNAGNIGLTGTPNRSIATHSQNVGTCSS